MRFQFLLIIFSSIQAFIEVSLLSITQQLYVLGGILALIALAVDDDGNRTGNTKNCKVPFYQTLYEVWKNMAKDGVIALVREGKKNSEQYTRTV